MHLVWIMNFACGINMLLLSMEYDKLTIGLIALAGVVIGAILQYFFTNRIERSKHKENLKMQAYVDLVKGIAGTAGSKEIDKQKLAEFNSLILDAKMRIAMYGSPGTIKKLSDFCANGSETKSKEGIKMLLNVLQSMRSDVEKTAINMDDIYKIMYNGHPQGNS